MRHPDTTRLNDYADGLLAAADRAHVEAHLGICDACRRRVDDLRALAGALAALPREIEPGRDLRPRHRIDAGKRRPAKTRRRNLRLRAAAALALAIGAAAVGRVFLDSGVDRPSAGATATASSAAYAGADGDLRALVGQSDGGLDAASLEILQQTLTTLDRAIEELEAAREQAPEDTDLIRMLRSHQRTRLDLLRGATAIVADG